MRRTSLAVLFLLVAGCSGPKAGDVLTVRDQAVVYFDEGLFRTAAQLDRAGSRESATSIDSFAERKADLLYPGARVRVLERTPDGLKVVVERAPRLEGKVGWVLASDVGPE